LVSFTPGRNFSISSEAVIQDASYMDAFGIFDIGTGSDVPGTEPLGDHFFKIDDLRVWHYPATPYFTGSLLTRRAYWGRVPHLSL
jgi:hypothetical protein